MNISLSTWWILHLGNLRVGVFDLPIASSVWGRLVFAAGPCGFAPKIFRQVHRNIDLVSDDGTHLVLEFGGWRFYIAPGCPFPRRFDAVTMEIILSLGLVWMLVLRAL